jgi:hypothetical protein
MKGVLSFDVVPQLNKRKYNDKISPTVWFVSGEKYQFIL